MEYFYLVVTACVCLFAGAAAVETSLLSRPNILFLMADQMRSDAMGCSGNKVAKTPSLDRLASQGARFSNAFSATPTCTPARSAILTGLSPWYHGLLGDGAVAHRYAFEMPRTFSDNGYYTHSIGKDHFGWNMADNEGLSHGYNSTWLYDGLLYERDDYDQWFMKALPGVDPMATGLEYNDYRGAAYALPEFYHPTAWVGRAAVDFVEEYNKTEPFFLKVSFHRPHSPYDPPQRWMEKFRLEDMPAPYCGGNWDLPYAIHYNSTPAPDIWCGDLSLDVVRRSRQAYFANVAFVDEWIGSLMKALEKCFLLNDTLILFVADHGDMLGDHYHWRKSYPYFGSASIPMLLKWPPYMDHSEGGDITSPRGSVVSEVTELRDVFPTFMDAAGIATPESVTLNGSSMLDLLREPVDSRASDASLQSNWREYIDLEHNICYNVTNYWNALTDGRTKYIFQAYYDDEQLFDLVSDPHEMTNLAGSPQWQEELKLWRQRMVEQFEREGRGVAWVSEGKLQRRVKGFPYSPNYPRHVDEEEQSKIRH